MNRLKFTLILSFFLIAILPLGALVYISSAVYSDIIHKEVGNSLSAIADHKLTRWKDYEKQQRQRIKLVSRSSVLRENVANLRRLFESNSGAALENSKESKVIRNIVRDIKSVAGFRSFYLLDPNGTVLYQDAYSDSAGYSIYEGRYHGSGLQKLFDRSLNSAEPVMSPFVEDVNYPGTFTFYIAMPIMDGASLTAIIVEQFDNRELINIAQDYTGIGETGEIVFATQYEGSALLMAPLRHVKGATYKKRIEMSGKWAKPIREALAGNSGVEASLDYRPVPVLAAWHPIESAGIGMVVKMDEAEAFSQLEAHSRDILVLLATAIVVVGMAGYFLALRIVQPVTQMVRSAKEITKGNLDQKVPDSKWYEFNQLGNALNAMVGHLKETISSVESDLWYKDSMTRLSEVLGADQSTQVLSRNVIRVLSEQLEAQAATIYFYVGDHLELIGHYGMGEAPELEALVSTEQGLVGQAIQDRKTIVVNSSGDSEIKMVVRTGTQETMANSLMIVPLLYHGQVVALIELAWLGSPYERTAELIDYSSESICLALIAAEQRVQVQNMLEESQAQTEELQVQQEELRVANEELRKKGIELRVQSENLRTAKEETDRQARELEAASRYKSEFLANMSHELRTPLNSLLILARSLMDNEDGNLVEDEVESASVIHDSGKHLLGLINDILDISKVESGKMQLNIEPVSVSDLLLSVKTRFDHMAKEKGSEFVIEADSDVPAQIHTDGAKLNQVLINLIGNAIKFTERGIIKLRIHTSADSAGDTNLNFSVEDTGIGIPEDKLQTIFQAFQQVDGSISRVYGGTGLGLSIARKLSEVLGGDITVSSVVGQGSCFSLEIPLSALAASNGPQKSAANSVALLQQEVAKAPLDAEGNFKDDRQNLQAGKPLLLIVEDDEKFSDILLQACHQQNCQAIVAADGESGIAMAEQYPVQGVILDYMLPGLDGSDVLAALKSTAATQDLPVHVFTALDGLSDMQIMGAVGKSLKPSSPSEIKTVINQLVNPDVTQLKMLVVEDDHATFLALTRLLRMEGVALSQARSGQEAVDLLREKTYDGVILDLGLPDTNGFELLQQLDDDDKADLPPVIIYTGRDLSLEEQDKLGRFTQQIVIKSDDSAERMLEEIHTFASLVCRSNEIEKEQQAGPAESVGEESLNTKELSEQQLVANAKPAVLNNDEDIDLDGRTILLVDDDMRNTFALAKVLRKRNMVVHLAPGGAEAIKLLQEEQDIELVLMDIMMPQMDGYETMRRIREIENLQSIPILALTANAMKGDKEKCLEAGANDYLPKPIDVDRLLVLMQMWLPIEEQRV
ncbi:response regulator [uncultured Pseudoteredinibacter sp.]|uniref:response regulator n=1 Tax=uncultured Pseudoteredinibacter sp. TaxID=1641701 RepID=UPI0026298D6B|nr:response regulator [uncultured Pseudoteredinibacter sp.]